MLPRKQVLSESRPPWWRVHILHNFTVPSLGLAAFAPIERAAPFSSSIFTVSSLYPFHPFLFLLFSYFFLRTIQGSGSGGRPAANGGEGGITNVKINLTLTNSRLLPVTIYRWQDWLGLTRGTLKLRTAGLDSENGHAVTYRVENQADNVIFNYSHYRNSSWMFIPLGEIE